jgi:hypothetical protein
MTIGIWASVDLVVNPFSRALSGQVDIVANLYCNLALRLNPAFGVADIAVPPPPPPLRRNNRGVTTMSPPAEFPPPSSQVSPIPEPTPSAPEVVKTEPEVRANSGGPKPGRMKLSNPFR